MTELYQNGSIQNLEWNLSPGRGGAVFSFELVSHGKTYQFDIQNEDAVKQLAEIQRGMRIRAVLISGAQELNVWKQPGNHYRMDCHLGEEKTLSLSISQKEMEKLFYAVHQMNGSN